MLHKQIDIGYVVRLQRGEEVVSSLIHFAAKVNLKSGFVTGLGAISDVKLGYFDIESKDYITRTLAGDFELISLTGNFSILEGKPFLHAHVVIADRDLKPYAGHLYTAKVAVTGEFMITSAGVEIARELDDETGLNLLKL